MNNPDLQMNFNVFDQDAERQELQKNQAYINTLNANLSSASGDLQAQITALVARVTTLEAQMVTVLKYIADHP